MMCLETCTKRIQAKLHHHALIPQTSMDSLMVGRKYYLR